MAKRVKLNDEWKWASPALKEQLRDDPKAVLRDRGLHVPDEMPLAVIHEFIRVVYLLWVDGVVMPINHFQIDPADEGLLFGRGVWESTRTIGGEPWLWAEHLARMKQSASVLGIALDEARLPTATQVRDYVRGLTGQDVIVRLNATAGRPNHTGLVWMSAAPLPAHAPSMRLQTVRNPVQKGQAYLTLKTFHYATRLRLGQQANNTGYDSALLLDDQGNVLEASHANIFLRLPDGWVTPKADGGLLPGTVRHVLIVGSPFPIREQVVPQSLLSQVREAFVTNSNVGIVPVVQIDQHTYGVGEETLALKRWLEPPTPAGTQYHFVNRVVVPR